ncbi:MAG: hypothetical protein IJU72_02090 [Bacteroidales bacterium]|nr:hypothetical protein [Bacteroidales bacterium]
MLKLFRTARPLALMLVVLVAFALWAQSGLAMIQHPPAVTPRLGAMPLYTLLLRLIPDVGLGAQLLALVMLLAIALYALHVYNKHIIIKQRSAMPALMLVLVASSIVDVQRLSPALLASMLELRAIDCLFGIYSSKHPVDGAFRAGFVLALAVLFYAPATPLVVLLFVGLLLLRPFVWREWVAALVGLLTPVMGYMLVLFLSNTPMLQGWELFVRCLLEPTVLVVPSRLGLWGVLVGFGLPALVALLYLPRHVDSQKIAVRKAHLLNLWVLLIMVLAFVFVPGAGWEFVILVSIPLSLLLSDFFVSAPPSLWTRLLFALPFVGLLAVQLMPWWG